MILEILKKDFKQRCNDLEKILDFPTSNYHRAESFGYCSRLTRVCWDPLVWTPAWEKCHRCETYKGLPGLDFEKYSDCYCRCYEVDYNTPNICGNCWEQGIMIECNHEPREGTEEYWEWRDAQELWDDAWF
jgi:hypothetical protein